MRTSGLGRFTLGQPVPARPHAVCVSLPHLNDLIGYEEKDPKTLAAMPTGYPRFVRHTMITRMIDHLSLNHKENHHGYLFTKRSDCDKVIERYQVKHAHVHEEESWTFLQIPKDCQSHSNVTSHFQHTGCGISSRLAEDYLWNHGLLENREVLSEINEPSSLIKDTIAEAHGPEVDREDILLASSGANAFHALFHTAVDQAKGSGKSIWIRWGWLYLDTIEVMNLYNSPEGKVIELNEVQNIELITSLFRELGEQIAGVITEFPTNPLLQAGDLEKVKQLCIKHNALLVIDPTMVSPKNAKITSLADVVVNSLTKYAGWEGDVMMGSLAFPKSSTLGKNLFEQTKSKICPPYSRDLVRMAEQIPFYNDFIKRSNASAMRVAEYLQKHPKIKKLYWAYQEKNLKHYHNFAGPDCPGCNLSFEIEGDFQTFYNRLQMLKSPSFGTEFSNCCPYVFLAHYQMIKSQQGRGTLERAGISPYLMRLSVGLEPVEHITQTIDDALQ